jgi:Dictyostelium (slime mold) repeat
MTVALTVLSSERIKTMITRLKKLRCCCNSLCRADAVRCGMIMMAVVGLLFTADSAVAQLADQACIKEKTGLNNPACTANDVRIGRLEVISGPTSCKIGDTITVTLRATIESGPARYDIGLWVNEKGNSARSDTSGNNCFRDFLSPPLSSTTCQPGGNPYYNAPTDGDQCGDLYAVGTNPCGSAVTGPCSEGGGTCLFTTRVFTMSLTCEDSNSDGTADTGTCTSWDQNAGPGCTDVLGTDPGTGSKCNCGQTPIIGLHIGCSVDGDCDDSNACTTDTCSISGNTGTCVHTAISCDDSNACTTDACDPATGCTHTAISCDDSNACTTDGCDPASGCTHQAVNCDDSNACTTDGCNPASGCTHQAVNCDDGNACTTDGCNPASGCTHQAVNCDDGNACTTDSCNPASGCVNTAINCDDGDPCTADSCDASGTCVHTPSCPTDTQIAPTATTCSDYTSGTAADLTQLLYGTRGGVINSVSPGVMFLYDGEHLASTGTVTVTETDGAWTQRILPRTGQVILYDLNCNKLNVGTVTIDQATGNVTITGVPAGDYILGIKYDTTTLKGQTPSPASETFTFQVTAGGVNSGSDSVTVIPKP